MGFRSDSPAQSSGQNPHSHQRGLSDTTGYSQSQGLSGEEDDGQAEDLVSDVHQQAQQASQSAVLAGQEQQQKVITLIPLQALCKNVLCVQNCQASLTISCLSCTGATSGGIGTQLFQPFGQNDL